MIYDEILQLNKEVRERFEKLERRIRKNEVISGFYEGIYYGITQDCDFFSADYPKAVEINRQRSKYLKHVRSSSEKVKSCCQWFDVEYYPLQGVKDVTLTFACNNKFCDACQSALAQRRYEKFAPFIDALQNTYDVAHVVFTVPNCKPKVLKAVLDRMYEARKYMIRYLAGSKKIRGIDLEKYGYEGAVISVEVTRNIQDGTYHPHFHCVMIFKKHSGVFSLRKHLNSYKWLMLFYLHTGVRRSEGLALQWSDIDFAGHLILIRGTKTDESYRYIPLTDEVFFILEQQRKQNKCECCDRKRGKYHQAPDCMVFPFAKEQTSREFKRLCPNHHLHDLRHTFITRCAECGVNINVCQQLVGHSTADMTLNVYTHVMDEFKRRELQKFSIFPKF